MDQATFAVATPMGSQLENLLLIAPLKKEAPEKTWVPGFESGPMDPDRRIEERRPRRSPSPVRLPGDQFG